MGVGSIIQLNNARVAKELDLDMVIIASGGLGSAFDEICLNLCVCQHFGVKVRGVILNRVKEDKRDMILEYFPRALKQWNIPLIGCLPIAIFLATPQSKTSKFFLMQHFSREIHTDTVTFLLLGLSQGH